MKRFFFLLLLISALILLDLYSKTTMLDLHFQGHLPIKICSLFNLSLAWNPGISFGFLEGMHAQMPYILSGMAMLLCLGLTVWMIYEKLFSLQIGFAFIIAGGLANAYDRLVYGAVVDFLQFHYEQYYFPTFNIADVCINIGVGVVLLEMFILSKRRS